MRSTHSYSKKAAESEFSSRQVVMPHQINPNSTLFGGELMAWIDKMAFMTAQRHSERGSVVTVNIDQISFRKPIRVGDHVILSSKLVRVGKTSMDIKVTVEREDGDHGNRELATTALLTFVAVDNSGRPTRVPGLVIEEESAKRDESEANLRMKIRDRFNRYFERVAKKPALGLGVQEH